MIRVENLVKNYAQVRALDRLSLEVEAGAVYGFLGPNGAGKTTTLRILSGLARPDQGRAWILDHEVGRSGADVRSLIGVLPEEPAFYPWMTAREFLRDLIAPLYDLDSHTASRRTAELLDRVGLGRATDRRTAGFSRGMRQRLGLAQALVHQPKVLLLDEPLSALDPGGRKEILDLIDSLRCSTTILFSTHILADVERICDVIGIIDQGRMVIQSARQDLLAHYATPLIEVEFEGETALWAEQIRHMAYVEDFNMTNGAIRLRVTDITLARQELLAWVASEGVAVRRFELLKPSLEDVFLRLIGKEPAAD